MSLRDPLESCRHSVAHAKDHIEEVRRLARSFCQNEPYAILREPDPLNATHDLITARLVKALPLRLTGIARDAVVNLRNALDHLGYGISVASGGTGKKAHFPFGKDATEIRAVRTKRYKDIPEKIFELMVALCPYKGGNETLWALNKLAGTTKHDGFIKASIFTSDVTYKSDFMSLTKPIDSTDDEIKIAWLRKGVAHPYNHIEIATLIRFVDVSDRFFERDAVEILDDFARVVERVIVCVELEARRLGYLK